MNTLNNFLSWSERSPYGLLIAILILQGGLIAPIAAYIILLTNAPEFLISVTGAMTMGLLVINLSLQPPRIVATCFLVNVGYHFALISGLLIGLFL